MEINSPTGEHARQALEVVKDNIIELGEEHNPQMVASFSIVVNSEGPQTLSGLKSLLEKVNGALKQLPKNNSVTMNIQVNDVSDFYQQLLRQTGSDLDALQKKKLASKQIVTPDKKIVAPNG